MSGETRKNPCQICGNTAYRGWHFQVDCCRACAAFYRRSINAGKFYKCKNGHKKCELVAKVKGVSLCRYCRFEKCKELGMVIPREVSPTSSRSSMDLPNFESEIVEKSVLFSRFDKTNDEVRGILAPCYLLAEPSSTSFLHRLEKAFMKYYEQKRPADFVIIDTIDVNAQTKIFIKYKNEMAKILMHCKEFAELNFEDKIFLHKHVTHLFSYIERLYTSIELGCAQNNSYCMLVQENLAVDLYSDYNVFNLNAEELKKKVPFFMQTRDKLIHCMYNPMLKLQITQFELIFLLAQILWSTQEIRNITTTTHDIAYSMLDQISNELHDYYVYELELINYGPRLINILKLIDGSKAVLNDLQNMILMSQMFNIINFNADLSELCEPF